MSFILPWQALAVVGCVEEVMSSGCTALHASALVFLTRAVTKEDDNRVH